MINLIASEIPQGSRAGLRNKAVKCRVFIFECLHQLEKKPARLENRGGNGCIRTRDQGLGFRKRDDGGLTFG